jgi:hypothetical protein
MINKFIDQAWGRISWEPSDPIVYGWGPTTMIQHCSHAAIFYCSNGPNLAVATIVMRRSSNEQFWRQRPVKLVAMDDFDVHTGASPTAPPSRAPRYRATSTVKVHATPHGRRWGSRRAIAPPPRAPPLSSRSSLTTIEVFPHSLPPPR